MRKSWTTRWNPITHTRPSISAAAKVWLQKLWIQSFPPCPRAPLKSLFPMWSPLKSLFLCWSASEVHLAENSGVWCAPPPASRLSADISALVICTASRWSPQASLIAGMRAWFSRIFIRPQEADPSLKPTHLSLSAYQVGYHPLMCFNLPSLQRFWLSLTKIFPFNVHEGTWT